MEEEIMYLSGLRFIQLMKNSAYHAGIKKVFGLRVKGGLNTTLPQQVLENITSEEELEVVVNLIDEHLDQEVDEIIMHYNRAL